MTSTLFLTYVKKFICPILHLGEIVIADNLRGHNVTGVKEAVEAMGAQIRHLRPYSLDLNPIEQLTAKLKALLRNRHQLASWDALRSLIWRLLDRFTPNK